MGQVQCSHSIPSVLSFNIDLFWAICTSNRMASSAINDKFDVLKKSPLDKENLAP